MRGKKPKERECYLLRAIDGTLVEVTREVYLEWYQSKRRERYQLEKMQKHGVSSLEVMEEQGCFQKSYLNIENEPEKMALKNICVEKLKIGLKQLSEQDAYLIDILFFKEVTVTDAAQMCGCSRKTIQNRRKRILEQLNVIMRGLGIMDGCF